jgi:uncharacterized membrane protein YdfJ with MMPL/SSD domain
MSGLEPLRNYFYWAPHCFDIPICAALRSIFDALDRIDALSDRFGKLTAGLDKLNALQPQLMARSSRTTRLPPRCRTRLPSDGRVRRTTADAQKLFLTDSLP